LPYPKEKTVLHHIQLYQTLLSKIGIHKKGDPKLYLSDTELSFADAFLREHQMTPQHILIGVNPSAAFGSSKCWLKERFRELA
ncbi:glycosyltransferase family 9 protein, partial [Pseudomonas silesiensis]|uniref:glycosyltransferase family 9 protein n=1 Tax=Pseudomonas silesiensis TaxID=1853130 RepID=UPI0034D514DA